MHPCVCCLDVVALTGIRGWQVVPGPMASNDPHGADEIDEEHCKSHCYTYHSRILSEALPYRYGTGMGIDIRVFRCFQSIDGMGSRIEAFRGVVA